MRSMIEQEDVPLITIAMNDGRNEAMSLERRLKLRQNEVSIETRNE